MSGTQQLLERFREMPRLVQWGVYVGIGIIVFLIWTDLIAPKSIEFKERADRIAEDVRTVRDTEAMDHSVRQLRDTIAGLGPVQLPRPEAEGELALTRTVTNMLRQFSVTNDSFSARVQGSLRPDALPGVTGESRVQLVTGDLTFDASPDVAIAIISELESRPEIESITTVRMTRISGRRVRVTAVLEAWVLPLGAPRAGGSV